jgi:indole-3-glycerol phosphate synthase
MPHARQHAARRGSDTESEEEKNMTRQPKRDLRRRQQRRRKVRYLRDCLERTNDSDQRRRLIAKIKKLSPTAPVPDR